MLGFDSNYYRVGDRLRATLEEIFYNADVTPAELWKAVGRILERARLDRKWLPIDIERAGGPSSKTVKAIEAGDAGTVDTLEKYAHILDLSIVDVLHSVLAATVAPLSPEAAHVVRNYDGATVEGRQAILFVSNAVEKVTVARAVPSIPAAAARPPAPHPPRPGRRGSPRGKKP